MNCEAGSFVNRAVSGCMMAFCPKILGGIRDL